MLLVMLFSCEDTKESTIQLQYTHDGSSARSLLRETAVRHNIKVEPNIADTDLDSNMSAVVEVPVSKPMTVDYKNWTQEQPDIYYEYGSSDSFVVSHNSPYTTYVTIEVSVNADYPVPEIVVDNSTITDNATYTDNATWSDNFTYGIASTQAQATAWEDWWDNLSTSDNWSYISVGHIDNVTLRCDNATVVSQIITQLKNDNMTNWATTCSDNVSWVTGGCGQGVELKATALLSDTMDCRCNNPGDNVTTIRPGIRNRNWGGVGDSCSAPTQNLEVILKK
ncbi:MAG TPA: hypothetical protein EYF95_00145 [Flavobacteriales bacterium]|nr:hypothetical protein [Flavobacteriales bacterium]